MSSSDDDRFFMGPGRSALAAAALVLAALAVASLLPIPAFAQSGAAAGDAAAVKRGQRLYLRCVSCHDLAAPAAPGAAKTGPPLQGVVGRRVGGVAGYAYSKALAEQDFVWDAARLDAWLEKPTAIAPGTTMAFEGMPRADERQALIAYLAAQSGPTAPPR